MRPNGSAAGSRSCTKAASPGWTARRRCDGAWATRSSRSAPTDGPSAALAALRGCGLAGDAAFTVGQTVTVPVPDGAATRALAAITALGLPGAHISTRPPTLDDVYLRLTGDSLAA